MHNISLWYSSLLLDIVNKLASRLIVAEPLVRLKRLLTGSEAIDSARVLTQFCCVDKTQCESLLNARL